MKFKEFKPIEHDYRYEAWLKMYPQFPLYEDTEEDDNCLWLITDHPEVLCHFAATMKPDEYHGSTTVDGKRANCFWWD